MKPRSISRRPCRWKTIPGRRPPALKASWSWFTPKFLDAGIRPNPGPANPPQIFLSQGTRRTQREQRSNHPRKIIILMASPQGSLRPLTNRAKGLFYSLRHLFSATTPCPPPVFFVLVGLHFSLSKLLSAKVLFCSKTGVGKVTTPVDGEP